MAQKNRDDLKGRFKDGDKPTQNDFENLMDSFINQLDDGIFQPEGNDVPLKINAMPANGNVLDLADKDGAIEWGVSTGSGLTIKDNMSESRLFINQTTGEVGISTTSPNARLDIARSVQGKSGVKVDGPLSVELASTEQLTVKPTGLINPVLTVDEQGKLEAKGNIETDSDLAVSGNVVVNNNSRLKGTLDVEQPVTFDKTLTVKESVSLEKSTNIGGDITITGSTTVSSTLSVASSTTLGNLDTDTTTIKGKLVSTNSSGHIEIEDSVNISESLTVSDAVDLNSNLTVLGHTVLGATDTDILNVSGNIVSTNPSDRLIINDSAKINEDLTVDGLLLTKQNATFEKDINAQSISAATLTIDESTTLNGEVSIDDNLAVLGDLSVTGSVNLTNTLQLQEGTTVSEFSTDTTLTDNSDNAVPTEKAVKTYIDTKDSNTRSYIDLRLPAGLIVMWSGSNDTIPIGWAICDGTNETPDLRDKFIVGAGNSYAVGNEGGVNTVTLTANQSGLPYHTHTGTALASGNHSHTYWDTYMNESSDSGDYSSGDGVGYQDPARTTSSSGSHTHLLNLSTEGKNATEAHENRPPYYALCYIMKR